MGNESKGHFGESKAKCCFADNYPSSSALLSQFLPTLTLQIGAGEGQEFQVWAGQAKKNVDKDNGFSASPLNSIWTLTFRKMRTKTIFYDQLHEHLSNKWWSEVNHFETLAQTQLPMDPGDHVWSTEVVRRHFSLSLHKCLPSTGYLEMLRGMEMAPLTRPAIFILSSSSNAGHFITRRTWPEEDRTQKERYGSVFLTSAPLTFWVR